MTPSALSVLTAVTGRWESPLVRGLRQDADIEVVRRCADLADLLATAATGQGQAVVVSADLRRLDGDALERLRLARCAVVALVEPGDEAAEHRLRQLGVVQVLPADAAAPAVSGALHAAVDDLARVPSSGPDDPSFRVAREGPDSLSRNGFGDPRAPLARPRPASRASGPAPGAGRVVAVWGPIGAPGRTTTAVALASELAATGHQVLLVDADTYGSSLGQALGLLDEAPGLASAARAADHGTLDVHQLARLAPQVGDRLRVLTGIARAHRWPELRPASLGTVLTLARSLADWTVVDTGFCLEQDEELAYDTAAPRRNGATLAALEHADVVVAVGSGDPIGLQRLVRGLQDLAEVTTSPPRVVVTRVRGSAVGPGPGRRVRAALERYAGIGDPLLVPDDGAALDAAMLAGRTLLECAPGSPARAAYAELARWLAGGREATGSRTAGRRRRQPLHGVS